MDFLFLEQFGAPLWLWLLFVALLASLLAFDLGVLHKRDHEIEVKESLLLSAVYIGLGLAFGGVVWWRLGPDAGVSYLTGFIVEKSLSLDNIFVISMIFLRFSIPRAYRHRVLFWGVLFAIVSRGVMIGFGAALIENFAWTLYLFSAFLIFTGARTLISPSERAPEAENALVRFVRAKFNVTDQIRGNHFFVRLTDPVTKQSALFATPLFLALVSIELADLVFAVDSVPAIFAITTDPFVVYTSNIFAILGLRALFFALSAVMERFRYLEPTLALVLIFIGSKIFIADLTGEEIPPWLSLAGSIGIIAAGGLYSLWRSRPAAREWGSKAAAAGAMAALVLGLGWLVWTFSRDTTARYLTQPVDHGPVARAVDAVGVVEPRAPRRIDASVSGRVDAVFCHRGEQVAAGRVCARIDQARYRREVERASAALASAEARLEKSRARLSRSDAALTSSQAQRSGRSALEKTPRATDQTQARVKRDEAEVARRRAALAAAEAALARTDIVAPVSGVIVSREAEVDQIVDRTDDRPLFLVAPDIASVMVETPAAQMAEIGVGDAASILVATHPERLHGEVSLVRRPHEIRRDGKGRAIVSVPDPNRLLADGQQVSVGIAVDRRENVMRAPKRAIDYSIGRRQADDPEAPPTGWTRLWVLRNDKPTPVTVRLGANDGAYSEVLEGDLRPDDRLILGEEGERAASRDAPTTTPGSQLDPA